MSAIGFSLGQRQEWRPVASRNWEMAKHDAASLHAKVCGSCAYVSNGFYVRERAGRDEKIELAIQSVIPLHMGSEIAV